MPMTWTQSRQRKEAVEAIQQAKHDSRRVISVGTTTVRALEGVVQQCGELKPFAGEINMFIKPGFSFKVIDGLITNFHQPGSTLLVLVSAFAGHNTILNAYKTAVTENYRFYSFGDAMLIL